MNTYGTRRTHEVIFDKMTALCQRNVGIVQHIDIIETQIETFGSRNFQAVIHSSPDHMYVAVSSRASGRDVCSELPYNLRSIHTYLFCSF